MAEKQSTLAGEAPPAVKLTQKQKEALATTRRVVTDRADVDPVRRLEDAEALRRGKTVRVSAERLTRFGRTERLNRDFQVYVLDGEVVLTDGRYNPRHVRATASAAETIRDEYEMTYRGEIYEKAQAMAVAMQKLADEQGWTKTPPGEAERQIRANDRARIERAQSLAEKLRREIDGFKAVDPGQAISDLGLVRGWLFGAGLELHEKDQEAGFGD